MAPLSTRLHEPFVAEMVCPQAYLLSRRYIPSDLKGCQTLQIAVDEGGASLELTGRWILASVRILRLRGQEVYLTHV